LKKILIATDAWHPQVNGVVRSLNATARELQKLGYTVEFLTPNDFDGFEWPFYKDIKISFPDQLVIAAKIKDFNPDYIHIATEGTIGLGVRHFCHENQLTYTTSYHTRFPEYLKKMHGIPEFLSYAYFRWFHSKSKAVMVPSISMIEILKKHNFKNLHLWNRGVDLENFEPHNKSFQIKRPIVMYVGRVSTEKNIQDFMDLKTNGTKVVVGDGPESSILKKQYPETMFVGFKHGKELAYWYSQADVMVFPSRSDTYGLVLLEALACGVPFAAYPEPGPVDIASHDDQLAKRCCFVDTNLNQAVINALNDGNSKDCVQLSKNFTWSKCTEKFCKIINFNK
jgi:glycosyltransferase involved in cell wall biosynthesis